jgi:FAD/FMN-containing dehydrogenase
MGKPLAGLDSEGENMTDSMKTLLEEIEEIVGTEGVLTGEDVTARGDGWPPKGACQARAIIRPGSTEEVAAIMKLCHAQNQAVVTHGGMTGLVGGTRASGEDIVISLERMRELAPVDVTNRTVTAEAGVVLQAVHEAAEKAGMLFPLDLGARGSCTVGGNISTNAGGNSVIRYGMMRAQVLGIEAVLADGTVISSMHKVIKNNTGYDLKQLFIGSEGTLGIVTRAVLRLRPLPRSRQTALVAVPGFEQIGRLLQVMDTTLGGTLSAFEVLWNDFYDLIVGQSGKHGLPLSTEYPYYVLIESTGSHEDIDRARFERALEEASSQGLIIDAVVAQSRQQCLDLWAIREDAEGVFEALSPALAFDISLSITQMDRFIEELRQNLHQQWPDFRLVVFGHLGDGNIHLGLTVGKQTAELEHAVDEVVYGTLKNYDGVISAEHGIGLTKRDFLSFSRSQEEINLMRTLKAALDSKNILNPGKIFRSGHGSRE